MHSSNYFVVALGLALMAFATAAIEARRTVVSHVAKFDNTNGGVIGGVPVRGVTPLGEYEDLYYDNMGVIVEGDFGAGLAAQSPPNVLGYDAVSEEQGNPEISSDYIDSKTDYFCFKSFYFGCVVDSQESETGVPGTCTISITGSRHGKTVATQTATFTAKLPSSTMQFVQLKSSFSEVDTAGFETQGVVDKEALAVLFDNIAYDAVLY